MAPLRVSEKEAIERGYIVTTSVDPNREREIAATERALAAANQYRPVSRPRFNAIFLFGLLIGVSIGLVLGMLVP